MSANFIRPFSALLSTMREELDIVLRESKLELDDKFDEFGFEINEDENFDIKALNVTKPVCEDEDVRKRWTAEMSQDDWELESCWNELSQADKLNLIVTFGLPHTMRPIMWMQMSGALQKKQQSELSYTEIVKMSSSTKLFRSDAIDKELIQIMPTNYCFENISSIGIPKLERVLKGVAWLFPDIGYCQNMGPVIATLLLFVCEEDVFWLMVNIIEDILSSSFYTHSHLGVQADQRVLRTLLNNYLPNLDEKLKCHDIELSLVTTNWFLNLFAGVVHLEILLRIWDLFFLDGSIVLFRISLGMLKMKETVIESLENSADVFNALSNSPNDIDDVNKLINVSMCVTNSLTPGMIETYRRRHLAYLMADKGLNTVDVSSDTAVHLDSDLETDTTVKPTKNNAYSDLVLYRRREAKREISVVQSLLSSVNDSICEDDTKYKNIKQTEILVELREAILEIVKHFVQIDPKLRTDISLIADYSMESHAADHMNFINVSKNRKRRAKALLDFERHDDDELGFRKNDIITIISEKDEHCWIGELNGLRGWFPAKFVQMLDERSKQYSCAGDDSYTETVTDLVRGRLCPILKQVLEHGMKRPKFLGGPCHPWLFIEEAATKEIEKDYNSVYSRLVLCKTFRLDEDGKVLTPEELLYRCLQAINLSHDNAHCQMDVKLRSLICLGLNEQVLHLWLEVLCSCTNIIHKWYYPWSFMCSPGWVQIKCDLRILSQLSFNLSPDWELPIRKENCVQPLKDGVQDMLVKHHLFSWDI